MREILAIASEIGVDNPSWFLYLDVNLFVDIEFSHVGLYLKTINKPHLGVTIF
jgi:hypothetical protein